MSRQNADPMLVTEILGVHPQLLLDDIINGANETIYESVDSLEEFLRGWIEEKQKAGADADELRKELDQGMHSFQTLLEAHTDLAFDFFEAWSHRNIFVINANLPVVAPHHKSLDLEIPPDTERELQIEVESSRRKLEHMRKFYTKLRRMEAQAAIRRRRAEARVESLRFLETTTAESEQIIPALTQFLVELRKLLSEPLPTPSSTAESGPASKPTTSRTGYLSWAVEKLMKDAAVGVHGPGRPFDKADRVATPAQLQEALMDTRLDEGDTEQSFVEGSSSIMDEGC